MSNFSLEEGKKRYGSIKNSGFDESKIKRDKDGKFSSKGAGGKGSSQGKYSSANPAEVKKSVKRFRESFKSVGFSEDELTEFRGWGFSKLGTKPNEKVSKMIKRIDDTAGTFAERSFRSMGKKDAEELAMHLIHDKSMDKLEMTEQYFMRALGSSLLALAKKK